MAGVVFAAVPGGGDHGCAVRAQRDGRFGVAVLTRLLRDQRGVFEELANVGEADAAGPLRRPRRCKSLN